MEINSAVIEAIDRVLNDMPDQNEDFKRRFRLLIKHVLTGSYDDSEVRDTMESLSVIVDSED
jgi:endonuclease III